MCDVSAEKRKSQGNRDAPLPRGNVRQCLASSFLTLFLLLFVVLASHILLASVSFLARESGSISACVMFLADALLHHLVLFIFDSLASALLLVDHQFLWKVFRVVTLLIHMKS